jgi:secreted trypsin-like serine protease
MYQENGVWTIGGITSYGYGCSKRGFPGVYTRTVPYITWIKQKMLSNY